MKAVVIILLAASTCHILISASATRPGVLKFSYVLSFPAVDPVYGVSVASTVPAVDLALDYINNNSTLLPGLNLTYGQVRTLQVLLHGYIEADILCLDNNSVVC